MDNIKLINLAITARDNAYCPYSNFMVGAALLSKNGKVFLGANIENSAFTPGICAERSAFATAISAGEKDFVKIAVAGWPKGQTFGRAFPCGVCRQFMVEFCKPKFEILVAQSTDKYTMHTLSELLPNSFGPNSLS